MSTIEVTRVIDVLFCNSCHSSRLFCSRSCFVIYFDISALLSALGQSLTIVLSFVSLSTFSPDSGGQLLDTLSFFLRSLCGLFIAWGYASVKDILSFVCVWSCLSGGNCSSFLIARVYFAPTMSLSIYFSFLCLTLDIALVCISILTSLWHCGDFGIAKRFLSGPMKISALFNALRHFHTMFLRFSSDLSSLSHHFGGHLVAMMISSIIIILDFEPFEAATSAMLQWAIAIFIKALLCRHCRSIFLQTVAIVTILSILSLWVTTVIS